MIEYASDQMRTNQEIVKNAVSLHAFSLSFASLDLQNDSEIVMIAVSQDGNALQYASNRLRGNVDIDVTVALIQIMICDLL
jgi:hypothetical protein